MTLFIVTTLFYFRETGSKGILYSFKTIKFFWNGKLIQPFSFSSRSSWLLFKSVRIALTACEALCGTYSFIFIISIIIIFFNNIVVVDGVVLIDEITLQPHILQGESSWESLRLEWILLIWRWWSPGDWSSVVTPRHVCLMFATWNFVVMNFDQPGMHWPAADAGTPEHIQFIHKLLFSWEEGHRDKVTY